MIGNDEDVKYREIIKTLKSLQKVSTPAGFETELWRRINAGNYSQKKSFWENVLSPSRLIPSSALAAAVVILLLVFNLNTDDTENPLNIDPRVREDIITADNVVINEKPSAETRREDTRMRRSGDSSSSLNGRLAASASNPELLINKSGLNFRQIHLTKDEREQLQKLKERIKALWNRSEGQ